MEDQENLIFISENIRPISVNDAYKNVPGKGRIKTGDYKRFTTDMKGRLLKYNEKRVSFLEYLKKVPFSLETTLKIYVPSNKYLTKKGDINRNKGDCGNYRKCLQDVVFDWLGVDDKYSVDEHNHQCIDEQGLWGFSFSIKAQER